MTTRTFRRRPRWTSHVNGSKFHSWRASAGRGGYASRAWMAVFDGDLFCPSQTYTAETALGCRSHLLLPIFIIPGYILFTVTDTLFWSTVHCRTAAVCSLVVYFATTCVRVSHTGNIVISCRQRQPVSRPRDQVWGAFTGYEAARVSGSTFVLHIPWAHL